MLGLRIAICRAAVSNTCRRTLVRYLWTWGNVDLDRKGFEFDVKNSASVKDFTPSAVTFPSLPQNFIRQIVCGGAHTLLVSGSGSLYSCGLGAQGQLGQGMYDSDAEFLPVSIDPCSNVAAGFWHSVAASTQGDVYTWGSNKYKQLGTLQKLTDTPMPMEVSALKGVKIVRVECGAYHTLALSENREVYSWGMGMDGRLGHGSEDDEPVPKRIEALRNQNIVSIAAGYDHSAAVSEDGRLWMWGQNGYHQLGTGDNKNRLAPSLINIECNVKQAACGGFFSMAVAHNGFLYSWGSNMFGSLGLGDDVPPVVREPSLIEAHLRMRSVSQVSCGWKHALAVTTYGDVFAWGHGACGQLGMGHDHDLYQPTQIPFFVGKSLRHASAGFNHSAAF